ASPISSTENGEPSTAAASGGGGGGFTADPFGNPPQHRVPGDVLGAPAVGLPLPRGPHPHSDGLPLTDRSQVAERIRDASIVLLSVLQLDAALLSPEVCPHLRMIAVVASGTDNIDLEACRRRGIHVANTPHANADSVAEHALALYFAARRSVVLAHSRTQRGSGQIRNKGPGCCIRLMGRMGRCRGLIVGIVGYGAVGKKVARLFGALGMRVMGDAAATTKKEEGEEVRAPFDTVLRTASVLVLCLPRLLSTENLIGAAELEAMPRHAVLVNVARGGIVDEQALVEALRSRSIAGAATDPAGPETGTPLLPGDESLRDLNLITTPHVAWCAEDTNRNYNDMTVENVFSWLEEGD
ncbi:hypothetical protein PG997_006500, partial [Apiospora hydei]